VIHYTVSIADANAHHFDVVCTIENPSSSGQSVSLPAWIPGSYMIRDFAKNILWIRASSGGVDITIEKIDKQTWMCGPCNDPLEISYRIYAWDLSVRTAHLDDTHGFFNGTSMFLAVQGQTDSTHQVELLPPATCPEWKVATTLPAEKTDDSGWGSYECNSYDKLIDHPVEMGTYTSMSFEVCGVPHAIILTGKHNADLDRLAIDLTRICEHQVQLFGDPAPPVEHYLFLTMVVGTGYGGLEHRDSCALLCSREDLPHKGEERVTDGYRKFLGLCSHEYFHLWNIKRIRPQQFSPYKLDVESYTSQLWAFEGITSYFDDLTLVQSGIIDRESYLELLGETLTRLQRNHGKDIQSVTDSSLDAWTKFYQQDENANNAIVSYYTKGAVIALMIDLWIRNRSNHQKSLVEVMRKLWNEYGSSENGVPEGGIEEICHEIAGDNIPWLHDALYSTGALEIKPMLGNFGINMTLRPTTSSGDTGGTRKKRLPTCWIGAELKIDKGGAKVIRIADGGPLQQAGIAAGDLIIAIDQLQANEKQVKSTLYHREPGDQVKVHLFRRDELMSLCITLATPPKDTVVLDRVNKIDAEQELAQQRWLKP